MVIRIFILMPILFPFLTSYSIWCSDTPLTKLTMHPGDVKKLNFDEKNSLHLSKKNIVSITHVKKGAWEIVALKKGVLHIFEKTAFGQNVRRVLIIVKAKKKQQESKGLLWSRIYRDFVCNIVGVHCDRNTYRIWGKTDSFKWFYQAKKLCQKYKPCIFDVSLSEEGIKELHKNLDQRLGSWFRIVVKDNGQSIAICDCPIKSESKIAKFADHLSAGAVSRGELSILCSKLFRKRSYTLRAKAFLLKDNEAQKIGLDFTNGVSSNFKEYPILNAFLEQNRSRIIGESLLRLFPGTEGEVHSGSEIQYFAMNRKVKSSWKKMGFSLKATAYPSLKDEGILLTFKLKLSYPTTSQNPQKVLQISSMQSKVILIKGIPKIVGQLKMITKANTKITIPYLNGIPIIGPLFNLFQDGQAYTKLFLCMWISDDAAGTE